jgi:hypothetical protein
LLHELAHAMTSHADGRSDGHGPLFMGIYVQLIARYLRLDRQTLISSLRDSKVDILCEARPVFVDPPARTATTRPMAFGVQVPSSRPKIAAMTLRGFDATITLNDRIMLYPPGRAAAPDTAGKPERPGHDLPARERTAIFEPARAHGWAWS